MSKSNAKPTEKMEEDGSYFHCPQCGSLRVIGSKAVALNQIPQPDGSTKPTVTQAEIDSFLEERIVPANFRLYCAACGKVSNEVLLGEHLKERNLGGVMS